MCSGKRRYNIRLWKTFTDCFNCLPVAAILDEKIFCCHGGKASVPLLSDRRVTWLCCVQGSLQTCSRWSRSGESCGQQMFQIKVSLHHSHVYRTITFTASDATGLLCDLLWSDPDKETNGWGENDRGVSFTFGPEIVSKFLAKHDMDLICRAHQVLTQWVLALGQETIVLLLMVSSVAAGGGGWLRVLC